MRRLRDQVIVITGASSGIGLATALAAARAGARVVLAARNSADLEGAVRRIEADGGAALAVPTDVSDYEQVEALADRAVAAFGRIDTWINNAAVSAYAPFVEMSLDDVRRIMEVNFLGQVYGVKAALPHLERSHGVLICVGSTLSDRGVPLQGIYCASKHALKGWIDSLRVELRQAGSSVRITLIKPSSINTPLFNKAKTQLGVMPQPIPPIYEPELAAAAILGAAERPKRDAFVGGAGKMLSVAERISPKLVDVQQRFQGFESQKTAWPKAVTAPSNLYAPVAHDGGVRGDFTGDASQRSAYQAMEQRAPAAAALAGAALLLAAGIVERRDAGVAPALLRTTAFGLLGKALVGLAWQR